MISEAVFILLLIMSYGFLIFGYFYDRIEDSKQISCLFLAVFFLFATGALSPAVGNAIIGLINIPLAVIAGGLAISKAAEVFGW